MKIPREAAEELHGVMSFRVYAGCPRTLGFRADGGSPYSAGNSAPVSETIKRNTTLRAAKPIAATPETTIVIPSMKGARATVAIFYGADPGKYAVVDFSDDPNQEARFGYVFRGSTMFDDLVTDSQNRTTERRICS